MWLVCGAVKIKDAMVSLRLVQILPAHPKETWDEIVFRRFSFVKYGLVAGLLWPGAKQTFPQLRQLNQHPCHH
jgi:hypothetical protein